MCMYMGYTTLESDMESSRFEALIRSNKKNKRRKPKKNDGYVDGDTEEEEERDVEAWDTLNRSFKRAQTVLDQNRDLIERVNENHRSKIPDNLARNVRLINEINGNISKVLEIYSDLSAKFTNIVHQRRREASSGDTTTTTTTTGGQGTTVS